MTDATAPTPREARGAFARIGFLSFGGPAAQIALMHRLLVEERGWLTERQFLSALSFCMLLPGPEAMQLATYAGWRLHGTRGGLVAGLLFVAPGAAIVLALAVLYATLGETPLVEALFHGVRAAVLIIVVQALIRVARRALITVRHRALALAAFVALFFLALPYPLVVAAAAAVGFLYSGATIADRETSVSPGVHASIRPIDTARTVLLWLALWWLPVLALALLSPAPILAELARFFSTLAVVTFGGAYAVLAYLAQDIVARLGWLSAAEVLDALALAETTPGPLILVTEFVGFLAAFRAGGLWLGLVGAAVTLWVTFVPCFLWIFAGAPYLDWLSSRPRLRGALDAITAAVVGVMLNLSLWFALHTLFGTVERTTLGPLTLSLPQLATLDIGLVALGVTCAVLTFRLGWSVMRLLAFAAVAGVALQAF